MQATIQLTLFVIVVIAQWLAQWLATCVVPGSNITKDESSKVPFLNHPAKAELFSKS